MADLSSDYGRTTRIVASGYDRLRVHQGILVSGERRVLVASFKGAMAPGRTIASARWQCDAGSVLAISNARLSDDKRETGVDLAAAWRGTGSIKVTVTLDNGEAMAQLAVFYVSDGCWFNDRPNGFPTGPTELTVTA